MILFYCNTFLCFTLHPSAHCWYAQWPDEGVGTGKAVCVGAGNVGVGAGCRKIIFLQISQI